MPNVGGLTVIGDRVSFSAPAGFNGYVEFVYRAKGSDGQISNNATVKMLVGGSAKVVIDDASQGNPNTQVDKDLVDLLEDMGFSVGLISDEVAQPNNFNNHDLVIVSDSTSSSALAGRIAQISKPVVVLEHNSYPFFGMTSSNNFTDNALGPIVLEANSNPRFGEFGGEVQVFDANFPLTWGSVRKDAKVFAFCRGSLWQG